jgi:hypothetical protein
MAWKHIEARDAFDIHVHYGGRRAGVHYAQEVLDVANRPPRCMAQPLALHAEVPVMGDTLVWVVLSRWCDDMWPIAVFSTEARARKRVDALTRLRAWIMSDQKRYWETGRGRAFDAKYDYAESWDVCAVPYVKERP